MTDRKARDIDLLDALDAQTGIAFEGEVWRITRQGRYVLEGASASGRWDPGHFDVLYTSLARDGALAEVYFHLSRQPVFPSKLVSILHRIRVSTRRTLKLADMAALSALGILPERYADLDYGRSQEIADAAFFLGFDGLLTPSARAPCQNLILFLDRLDPGDLEVQAAEPVDWGQWRNNRP